MKKQYYICGNWKMHKTVAESRSFLQELTTQIVPQENCRVIIFPPFTALYALQQLNSWIGIGAQNMHIEEKGAFTGEISALMLQELVSYVLIGHSERRHIFQESNEDIARKLNLALKFNLIPLLCVGETLPERKDGKTFPVIEKQLLSALNSCEKEKLSPLIVAYEPVWAIGTGINATPWQAEEVHAFIKELLLNKFKLHIPVLYGGSVKPANCEELLACKNIDGLLIGGASLQVSDFSAIILSAQKL